MNKTLIASTLALILTAPAYAVPGGEGNNTGCNGVGNANSPCEPGDNGNGGGGGNPPGNPGTVYNGGTGGQGGKGGKGGNASATGGLSLSNSFADSTSRSRSNSNANANATGGAATSNATGGVATATGVGGTGGTASASAGSASLNYTEAKQDFSDTYEKYTPSAMSYASSPTATCIVTGGVGFGVPGVSGSATGGVVDEVCQRLELVRVGRLDPREKVRDMSSDVMEIMFQQELYELQNDPAYQEGVAAVEGRTVAAKPFTSTGGIFALQED